MIAIGYFSSLAAKSCFGSSNIALSLFIITLLSPLQLFNIGLQLSFVSVLVIFYGLPNFKLFSKDKLLSKPFYKVLNDLEDGILLSALISIAITPFTLYCFGTASLNGIIGNTLGIPLSGILLPLSFLVLIFPQGWYLTKIFVLVYKAVNTLWIHWMQFCYNLPFSLSANYLSLFQALALATVILWGFFLIRGKFKIALQA